MGTDSIPILTPKGLQLQRPLPCIKQRRPKPCSIRCALKDRGLKLAMRSLNISQFLGVGRYLNCQVPMPSTHPFIFQKSPVKGVWWITLQLARASNRIPRLMGDVITILSWAAPKLPGAMTGNRAKIQGIGIRTLAKQIEGWGYTWLVYGSSVFLIVLNTS